MQYNDEIRDVITEKEQLKDLETMEILIQTVSDTEFYAAMLQIKKRCGVSRYTVKHHDYLHQSFYYVGKWGDTEIPVVIVQTQIGSGGRYGSYNETVRALNCLPNLKYIFAVGVCGGIKGKVNLGDVVVSKALQDCSRMKIMAGDKVIIRGHRWSLSEYKFYHFLSQAASTIDNTKCGTVLSANMLVADSKFQKLLLEACPDAIALEMEGHGIAEACQLYEERVQFLVVKGVSDLADGSKSYGWQPQAATNAAKVLCKAMTAFNFGEMIK